MEEKHKSIKKVPLGVKIIAIIYFILFIGYIALSIISIINPDLFQNIPGFSLNTEDKQMFFAFATVLMIFSLLNLFVAIGLLKLWNFSRIAAIIISLIFIIGQLLSIKGFELTDIISILNLAFNLIIVIYLLFNKKTRHAFKKIHEKKEEKVN